MSDFDKLYFLRTSKSHFYSKGSGNFSTPKMYALSKAMTEARRLNTKLIHPSDGPWEVVPVTITVGDPVPLYD